MPDAALIDPLTGPKLAIAGRIVTMNSRHRVITRGVVYIEHGTIIAASDRDAPPPNGFEHTLITDTKGTIFPGLIELHNHLPYDILPLWRVPKKFKHRGQWGASPEYQRRITNPMSILGKAEYVPSIARYVECKTLLAGVTTTQGIELFSNQGARRYYRGIVRNVEQTNEPELPEAITRIADVDARNAERFLKRLNQNKKLILHLSEGVGSRAREHFLALHIGDKRWAINENLVGIHCTGLQHRDFEVMARHKASMVWSPFSNLLLYGDTADVAAAKSEGVPIGIGSDWSPTGSKNLLGELKVARLVSRDRNDIFTDQELVSMATIQAANILGWSKTLGSIEAGKRADLMVIDSTHDDPYVSLLRSNESEVRLVVIGGVARAGVPSLIRELSGEGEELRVGGRQRMVYLKQATADAVVGELTLKEAEQTLKTALSNLPAAARKVTAPHPEKESWNLVLDEIVQSNMELRPRLPLHSQTTGPQTARTLPVTAPEGLDSIALDKISVVDDDQYLDLVAEEELNLPAFVGQRLRSLYD